MPSKEKTSYAIGMSVGSSIKRQEIEVDPDALFAALKDAIAGNTNHMSEQEMRKTLQDLGAAVRYKTQEAQREKMQKEGAENKAKGDAFLASNAKVEGVKTLPDGLQYKVIKEGSGELPKTNESVIVNYKGTLIDGTPFDARTNQTFAMNGKGVIKGWADVLPMMKPGAEWQVFIPGDLAYGPSGRPRRLDRVPFLFSIWSWFLWRRRSQHHPLLPQPPRKPQPPPRRRAPLSPGLPP